MRRSGANRGNGVGSAGRARQQALLIAGSYGLLGSLWIYLSDRLVGVLDAAPDAQLWMQTYKGWAFVAGSALLLFGLTRGVLESNRRLEQAVQAREQLFRNTFEHAAVGIAHLAPDGRFLRINRRLCEILGSS